MTSFFDLAASRYSVRSYEDRSIEPDVLAQVLEAGRIAPTAHNDQPQRIMVLTDAGDLAKVDECTRCRFGAPAVLLICYDKDVCWKRPYDGALSGEVDASIVTTHIMLAAHDLGLGTCWVMYFDAAKAVEVFGLPENIIPVAMLPIGFPAGDARPSPMHGNRVEIGSILLN